MSSVPTCLTCIHAYLPYVSMRLTCLRAFVPQITTCVRAFVPQITTCLRTYVPYITTCLRGYVPLFFTCLHAFIFHVPTCLYIFFKPTCLRAINYFVPTCAHFSRAYVKIPHKIYWGSLLYFVLLFLSGLCWPFIPLKTPKETSVSKAAYYSPILWGVVISTGACTERIIWGLIKRLSKTMDSF